MKRTKWYKYLGENYTIKIVVRFKVYKYAEETI